MRPRVTITRFDTFLADRSLRLDAVVVGGTALELLGVISRETKDCDVLHPSLPASILAAAREFAVQESSIGSPLAQDWLNNGPSSLTTLLPGGWESRVQPAFTGVAITFHVLGRHDLLLTKLFALCDRGSDIKDCLALHPTAEELSSMLGWVQQQDANPQWPAHVEATLQDLARRLGYGI